MKTILRIVLVVLFVAVFAVAQRKPDLSWQVISQDTEGVLHSDVVYADNIIQAIGNFQADHPENATIKSVNQRFFVVCYDSVY